MKTLANVLWFVLAGFWLAIAYLVAAVVMVITIIGIPFAIAAMRMASLVIWPFGRTVVKDPNRGAVAAVGNLLWIVLCGWWLALAHIVSGILLCITIIGIPYGVVNLKLIPLAFAPWGKRVVTTAEAVAGSLTPVAVVPSK